MTAEDEYRALIWMNVAFGILMSVLIALLLEVKSRILFLGVMALSVIWAITLLLSARKPKRI